MEIKESRVLRKSTFLLKDLLHDDIQYQGLRQQFKKILLALRELASTNSPVLHQKRLNLDQFTTTVMNCENDRSDVCAQKVKDWKDKSSEKCFLIYKTRAGWSLLGRNIAGKDINLPLNFLNDSDIQFRQELLRILGTDFQVGDYSDEAPIHCLVTDYFGYLRPSIFISYSWPDPQYASTYAQDERNKTAVHEIAKDLAFAGFRVLIDKDDLAPGLNLSHFMNLIADSRTDYICLMATPLYKKKYLNSSKTLGGQNNKTYTEASLILSHIGSRDFDDKVFTLLLEGGPLDSLPPTLVDKIFNKFTENDYFETILRLIRKAYGIDPSDQKINKLVSEFNNQCRPEKLSAVISPLKHKPVVIFTDPGVDDFAALGLALAPNVMKIKAIVACAGNIELDQTLANTLNICHLAHRNDIPVLKGSKLQINGDQISTDYEAHGDNGLNQVELGKSTQLPVEMNSTEYLIRLLEASPEPITLISLAGLTDVALLLKEANRLGLLNKIAGISMMGGVIGYEEANAPKRNLKFTEKYGEFNFLSDPAATHRVFELCQSRSNPIPIVLFDLNFTHHHCRFTQNETRQLRNSSRNRMSCLIGQALDVIPTVYRERFPNDPPSQPVHDIFPVMALLEDSLFEGEYVHVKCQSDSDAFPGKIEIEEDSKYPKIFRVTAIPPLKQEEFFKRYIAILGTYPSIMQSAVSSHRSSVTRGNSNHQSGAQEASPREYGAASPGFFKEGESVVAESSRGLDASASTGKASEQGEDRRPTVVTRTVTYLSAPESLDSTQGRGWLELASQFAPPKSQLKGEPNHEIVTPVYLQPGSSKQSDLRGPINK